MSQLTLNEQAAAPSTPSATKVAVYVDNATIPQLRLKDDAGNVVKQLDSIHAVTSASPSAGIGYETGAGSSATQGTSKATTVAFNAATGTITMHNASLAAAAIVSFTFTNTAILAADILLLQHVSGGTGGAYTVNAFPAAGSAVIQVRNNTAGALAEAIVLRFAIIRSVVA